VRVLGSTAKKQYPRRPLIAFADADHLLGVRPH
jgi:hypothetical protein